MVSIHMAIQFSDTSSSKNGLIQRCEKHCFNGSYGAISDDTDLLAGFTNAINDAYDEVLPLVFQADASVRFDDNNWTKTPTVTTNLVSSQRVYSFLTDSEGASILKILALSVKTDATTSDYTQIGIMHRKNRRMIENNSTNVGIPKGADIVNGIVTLDTTPNYSATAGLKAEVERTPEYFATSDTTKTPGIPDMFHRLLALIASHEWLVDSDSTETTKIARLEAKIAAEKTNLKKYIASLNSTPIDARPRITNPE